MEKLLSIVIPAYNMEAYLDKCVSSLMIQDADLRELLDVLIVNDGSNDRTSAIAHTWESNNPGVVRVIDKHNGNYGSCINVGLRAASGLFVKILDADDSFYEESLADYICFIKEVVGSAPDVDMILSDFDVVTEDGSVLAQRSCNLDQRLYSFGDFVRHRDYLLNNLAMHQVAYRTARVRELEYHQTEGIPYTDTEWIYEPPLMVRKVACSGIKLYKYLVGRSGQSTDASHFRRNYPLSVKVFEGLFERYNARLQRLNEIQRTYLQIQIERMARIVLGALFFGAPRDMFGRFMHPMLLLRTCDGFSPFKEIKKTDRKLRNCIRLSMSGGVRLQLVLLYNRMVANGKLMVKKILGR